MTHGMSPITSLARVAFLDPSSRSDTSAQAATAVRACRIDSRSPRSRSQPVTVPRYPGTPASRARLGETNAWIERSPARTRRVCLARSLDRIRGLVIASIRDRDHERDQDPGIWQIDPRPLRVDRGRAARPGVRRRRYPGPASATAQRSATQRTLRASLPWLRGRRAVPARPSASIDRARLDRARLEPELSVDRQLSLDRSIAKVNSLHRVTLDCGRELDSSLRSRRSPPGPQLTQAHVSVARLAARGPALVESRARDDGL